MTSSFSEHRQSDEIIALDASRTAVLVIDMINDFCTAGGAMMLPGADVLYPPQNAVMRAAREVDVPVVHIQDKHRHGMKCDREFLKRTPHCMEGEWGSAIVDELEQKPQDHYVTKRRFSGFFNTDLDLTLKDLGVDTLVVMGVVTNICVRSTVHDAFFLGYRVVVVEDGVAATGPREQASSLYDIATHFGVVSRSDSVIQSLKQGSELRLVECQ
ncbi:cysteine hydrolase family protein [Neopusillimonas maritima]|uniref:Isochorismatase n=1 Tax=Neopusillimonas maritima TaxID=2026239 RepID=A0ABX9N1A0_9BURK|nr:isochorismatase family cysteine hydrolase [Neopusillimonas maritima]RII83492.1 isochorismatase [Neopusillimonas maritima]